MRCGAVKPQDDEQHARPTLTAANIPLERVFGIAIDKLVRKPIGAAEGCGGAVGNRALL